MKKNLLLLILSTFFSYQLQAQWVSNTALNTLVSDDATMNETIPMCAPGLNGTTYISWFISNSSGSYDAMLQLLDVNGNAVWPSPIIVSNQPQSSALYNSDFTTDYSGNAIMAFQDIRNGNLETVIYKISATGNFVWGNTGIALAMAAACLPGRCANRSAPGWRGPICCCPSGWTRRRRNSCGAGGGRQPCHT
jgi:hypothetical protein